MIDYDMYVNVQGDEPLIFPEDIVRCIQLKKAFPDQIVNGFCWLTADEDPQNRNIPKVIANEDGTMVYMSRSPLPSFKDGSKAPERYMKQVCIYAFTRAELLDFKRYGRKSYLESYEDIEILRFLELGRQVKLFETQGGSIAVDIPEDVAKVEFAIKSGYLFH
jgi:3-deoxy-manno-octulosonate cytidylyltransferase (CMP-KDO synthetase)